MSTGTGLLVLMSYMQDSSNVLSGWDVQNIISHVRTQTQNSAMEMQLFRTPIPAGKQRVLARPVSVLTCCFERLFSVFSASFSVFPFNGRPKVVI